MDHKTKVCPLCKHLDWEDELHQCPSVVYVKKRDELIRKAAQWDDYGRVVLGEGER